MRVAIAEDLGPTWPQSMVRTVFPYVRSVPAARASGSSRHDRTAPTTEAEVSKRSFFRYFDGKEDLALTPLNDVWRTLIADLDVVLARSGPLLEVLGAALVDVVERMPPGWERLAVLSARLSGTDPVVDAAGMVVCERFTQQVVSAIVVRFSGASGADLSARIVCAVAVAGHRAAVDTWRSAPGAETTATRAELCALLRASLAAAPAALETRLT